jgi:hypothetical protein
VRYKHYSAKYAGLKRMSEQGSLEGKQQSGKKHTRLHRNKAKLEGAKTNYQQVILLTLP